MLIMQTLYNGTIINQKMIIYERENNNPDLWLVHPLKIGNYLEVCDMIHPRNDGVDLIFAKKVLTYPSEICFPSKNNR